jgi:serine/threonine protein kinase
MPAPATVDEFLGMVVKSGVVDGDRLDAHLEPLRSAGRLPSSPNAVADLLIRDHFLTRFQVQNFLQGKYLGFTLGTYRILDLLGSGGMSAVYLCEDSQRQRFALKVLPRSLAKDPTIVKRFYREARASTALDHPNIVRGFDVGQEKQQHFFVMEFVDGLSLQEMVKKNGPVPVERAVDYIRQAAIGLQHAGAAGLIHRDIKPGNLLVDRNGVVKILDMGLSRFYNDEESVLTKDVLGTLDYLAPEQARDSHTVDIRADIYSLGGTFYYLLTGQSPLATDSLDPKTLATEARRPRPIRELRAGVAETLVAIVDRMMAHDPERRFPNPAAVATALHHWTAGTTPPPEPESDGHRQPTPAPLPRLKLPAGAIAPEMERCYALPWALIGGSLLLAIGIVIVWWLAL